MSDMNLYSIGHNVRCKRKILGYTGPYMFYRPAFALSQHSIVNDFRISIHLNVMFLAVSLDAMSDFNIEKKTLCYMVTCLDCKRKTLISILCRSL